MNYLIDGIIIVFVLSCIIFFITQQKATLSTRTPSPASSGRYRSQGRRSTSAMVKIGTHEQTSLKELSTPIEAGNVICFSKKCTKLLKTSSLPRNGLLT